ncbi:hypothetical protein MSAN_01953400 [Mycena sanguinolenta]|uniref:F-box domain-containing protein n=1 Tax=Mycena sanguinolenta TaxID=230812 RepID=A0A8H6XL88_9AGAR|nr:hypothetical protein MSAN_01953400 [Mycena sanguinolenta]
MTRCSACGAFAKSNPDELEFNITIAPRTLARISELLTTNEPPQEAELVILRPVAEKTAERLACLDAEICRLRSQLEQLEGERAALRKYHAQNTTILSPSRRIPAEVLGEIFLWSLPSNCVADIEDTPWVLTHVSRRWRAVAISKSSLWYRIHLDFSTQPEYPLAMIRTQIERARRLKITFYGWQQGDPRPQVAMLQLLLEYSSMWEELNLELTKDLVPPMGCRRFPLLRRTWVQWDGADSQVAVESVDFFRRATSLVDITVFSEYRFIPTLLPRHHQLTRYDFDAPWTTHYELLRSLPNLHEVRIIRNFERGVPWPEPGEPIHLLHLQRMCISHVECLDYLSAPVLERIAIYNRETVETGSHLERFITRSSCAVRRLCISGLPDVHSTEKILRQHPSMTELALSIKDGHKDEDIELDLLAAFLARFTVSNSTGILPHISKLDIACEHADDITYPLYLDMLHSRWNAPEYALEDAEFLLPNAVAPPDPESVARMKTLSQAGMQISVSWGHNARVRGDQWFLIPTRA